MKTILFQGDSVTDAGREKEDPGDLGKGYPMFAAARLGISAPNDFAVFNRGVSGDRVVDLYARIRRDIINLSPDVLSILIGVNDVWHELDFQNGVDTPKFNKIYRMLLDEVLCALPKTKIILLEPFIGHGAAVTTYEADFRGEVLEKAAAVRALAGEYGLLFLPLQQELDALEQQAPCTHWTLDGVHPTVWLHQFIADRWLQAARPLLTDH